MTDGTGRQRSRCIPDALVAVFFEFVNGFVSTARGEVRGAVVGGEKEEVVKEVWVVVVAGISGKKSKFEQHCAETDVRLVSMTYNNLVEFA
ncbi:hypothetical protein HDU98_005811 [Podochytrium sp. JEL0797]|nr:hypothetical protein HDU98_005811 [Podochytrium sp. JEL0797]